MNPEFSRFIRPNDFAGAPCPLFNDGHLINQVLAAAQLVEDKEHVADVERDATLQVVVEVDVAA